MSFWKIMEGENSISTLEQEILELKNVLLKKEKLLMDLKQQKVQVCKYNDKFLTEEISRYSRQMLVPQLGPSGQLKLKSSSILIVGIGGLGCPAALYLAAAGIGNITILDYDEVEITNLHRQVLHSEYTIGDSKVQSAYHMLQSINSNVKIIPLRISADSSSLKKLFDENKYDAVLDGSDNVATRYLLNDICVLNNVPLVSGSALQLEGQLTVYNYKEGPCYRCLFPSPPPPNTVVNCGDGGVLGPVPGVIGVLQALETIKVLTGMEDVLSGRLLVFDGSTSKFMNVKIRNKKENCAVCGLNPTIKGLIDYEQFCGSKAHDKVVDISILPDKQSIDVREFSTLLNHSIVFDVRPKIEFEMCKLPNTINLPFNYLTNNKNLDDLKSIMKKYEDKTKVYFICRRGNDSQRAVSYLQELLSINGMKFINVKGGLHSYAKYIDSSFPIY